MRMFSQKTALLLWLSALLVTGFLSTSVLSYLVSTKAVRRGITDQALPLTGDNVYSEIQKDIVRPIFISSQMAHNTFLRDWLVAGETDQLKLLRYLKQIKQEHNSITAFLISEKTRRYYYTDGILTTIREGDPRDKWFFRVRSMQKPFETNVDRDTATQGTITIFINYRVLDYRGQFIGVTGVGLAMDNIKQILETAEKRFNRRIYFVDKTGAIVLASTLTHSSAQSIHQQPGIRQIAAQILKGSTKPLSLNYHLPEQGWSATNIQVNARYIPELDWHLLVEQDESDAINPLRAVLLVNLAVSSIATVLILLLILPRLHLYQKQLEKAATTDALTGLINRQAFDLLFSEYLQDAVRTETEFAAVMFDIDHFKQINDHYGHLAGDGVIKEIARLTKASVRMNDLIARWGGEEFIVLLKDCGLEQAQQVAEKMRSAVQNYDFELKHDRDPATVTTTITTTVTATVTISLGVTCYIRPETPESFFTRTDQALYLAKQQGRNRIETKI